jgi:DedD protein
MRTLFDLEEEDDVETRASEITLGTASLLGIFFGLVLVCGVFFGFGYSLGRGTAWVSQSSKLPDSQTAVKDDLSPAPLVEGSSAAPVAAEQPENAKPANLPPIRTETASDDGPQAATPADDTPAKPAPVVNHKPSALKEAPAYVPPADTPAAAATTTAGSDGKPMVQIAAVARPQDAYALITALHQHGYTAVMRSDPQDKLVHVQVGPFADRSQASAMKDKLLADGYNAIIKQ